MKGCEVCLKQLTLFLYQALLITRGDKVVLADGTVVEANASTHQELWRALKGGTSNFG